MAGLPRTEFAQALRAIASERGLDASVILETIKQAIIAAYKRDAKERGEEVEELEFDVKLDPTNGEARIFSWSEGEDEKKKDVTPPGFGRIAAQTAKQVIHQKIREAEKDAIMDEFSGRAGALISGMILRFDGPNVRVDLGRTEGLMPAEERVPNERLTPNARMTFLLKEIKETPKGKLIILSRSDPVFVKKLFEREVPEISSGSVEVRGIAREAGVRTKIAVFSNQSGVDPVGSCVGQKGVRVQAVTNELGGERVDIVPWSDDVADLIKAALSPAGGTSVSLNEKEKIATVTAPEDQLSMAIGREGQNARLAAKLTGWRIEVEGIPGEKVEKADQAKKVVKDGNKETVTAEIHEEPENAEGERVEKVVSASRQIEQEESEKSKSKIKINKEKKPEVEIEGVEKKEAVADNKSTNSKSKPKMSKEKKKGTKTNNAQELSRVSE